jgi:hypothetical protein
MPRWPTIAIAFPTLAALAIGGCSKSGSSEDATTTALRQIANAYSVPIKASQRPPKTLDEIKQVLTDLHTDNMNPPADEVLISPRDKQPYVIILGAMLGTQISGDILIYEKNGAEGKRYVFTMSYDVKQLTDDEFAKASFAMGHKPAK